LCELLEYILCIPVAHTSFLTELTTTQVVFVFSLLFLIACCNFEPILVIHSILFHEIQGTYQKQDEGTTENVNKGYQQQQNRKWPELY